MSLDITTATAADIQEELRLLYVERALAAIEGLDADPAYLADLEDDIDCHRVAFEGAAVTEIAVLRADLGGILRG
jgi:hypothetical protein